MDFNKTYKKAPIIEAIFEVQIEPHLVDELKQLVPAPLNVAEQYPEIKPIYTWTQKLKLGSGKLNHEDAENELFGYQFWNKEKNQVCQYRKTGFSFSRLAPYSMWENHFPEFLKRWNEYYALYKPVKASNIILRYIDSFDFNETSINLDHYFNGIPSPPSSLPQNLTGFIFQYSIEPEANINLHVSITPKKNNSPEKNGQSIILDTVVSSSSYNLSKPSVIEEVFNKLRIYAVKVFEASITEQTRRMIDE